MTKDIRSDIGWSTVDRIVVRGKDLPNEILGHLNLGDMAFLELTGRAPDAKQSKLFNAMVVTLVEHGVTPSAMVARLTYLGALGSVFVGSMEGVARILADAVEKGKDAKTVLAENKRMPGLGHPIHKPIDPRSVRLFEIARQTGFYGKYCQLMEAIARERNITLNATGAIGALACELGLDWKIVKGLGVMARAVGLVGHLLEETRQPMAETLWLRTEDEATRHHKK
jgi:citrate synthase